VSQVTINLGTRGPRTFVRGHIVSGCPVTPPFFKAFTDVVNANHESVEKSPLILTMV